MRDFLDLIDKNNDRESYLVSWLKNVKGQLYPGEQFVATKDEAISYFMNLTADPSIEQISVTLTVQFNM